ncbi:hypothetical protein K3495_g5937 [Podosphaera aphanis]|nr:hypothetical protein K3495_g5937 [Podosphaera aphanis]
MRDEDKTNIEKRVGFKREDYRAKRAREFNGYKRKDHHGTFRKRGTDYQSDGLKNENLRNKAYNTEPNNQDSDNEEAQSHSEPESPDPYDSAYFQGIKEDGSDSDLVSESEPANLCEAIENYNTYLDEIEKNIVIESEKSIHSVPASLNSENKLEKSSSPLTIVSSTASKSTAPPGYAFRGRCYAQIQVSISSPHNNQVTVCLDTGCAMSLIDRTYLRSHNPTAKIHRMDKEMKVRGLGTALYDASEFTEIDFYIHSKDSIVAHFRRKIHIVETLAANALIGIDIAAPEGWVTDLDAQKLVMPKCHGISINIYTQFHAESKSIPVFAKNKSVIQPQSRAMVAIAYSIGNNLCIPDRDMVYEPIAMEALTTFPCLVSKQCDSALIQNDSNIAVTIGKHTPLGKITDVDLDAGLCGIDGLEAYHIVAQPSKGISKSRLVCKGFLAAASSLTLTPTLNLKSKADIDPQRHAEQICPNGVTIYGNQEQRKKLRLLVHEYGLLWQDQQCFAKTPTGEEMSINLVPDWHTKYKAGQVKVYMTGTNDRQLIDKTFDTLHKQGRLRWTQNPTPFSFPCFVIWKNIAKDDGTCEKKGRVVIDIRALNQITLPDAYPIPTQADIIAAVSGCNFISTIDCASFFYQWRVKDCQTIGTSIDSQRRKELIDCPSP